MADTDNQVALKDFFATAAPEANDPNKAALKNFFVSSQGESQSPEQALAAARRPGVVNLNALKAGTGGMLGAMTMGAYQPEWAKQEPLAGGPLTAEEKMRSGVIAALPAVAGSALLGAGFAPAGLRAAGALTEAVTAAKTAGATELEEKYLPGVPYLPEITALGLSVGAAKTMNFLKTQQAERTAAGAGAQSAQAAATAAADLEAAKQRKLEITRLHEDPLNSPVVQATNAAESQEAAQMLQARHTEDTLKSTAEKTIGDTAAATNSKIKTPQEFGEAAQTSARNWLENVKPQQLSNLRQELFSYLPKGSSVSDINAPIHSTVQALEDINQSSGAMEELSQVLKPKLPAQLKRTFENKYESPWATKEIEGLPEQGVPGKPSEPITLADQMQFRTVLGDALADNKISSDVGKENIKRLYAAISDDIREGLTTNGVPHNAWDKYNFESSRIYHLAENQISDIITTGKAAQETQRPGLIADKIRADKDGTWLQGLRSEPSLSPIVDYYTSHILRDKVAGALGSAAEWRGLSPEAQAQMIPNAQLRDELDKALTLREVAPQLRKAHEEQAVAARQEAIKQAELQRDLAMHQANLDLDSAKASQPVAAGKVPEKTGWIAAAKNALTGALEGEKKLLPNQFTGAALGELGSFAAGLSPELQKLAVAAGVVAPVVLQQGKRVASAVIKDPASLRFPAEALAGAESQNQLMK